MDKFITQTIKKIKEERIKPYPRWKFLLEEYSVWFLFIIIAFLGGIALSVAYFLVTDLDWDIVSYGDQNVLQLFLHNLPYVWLIIFSVFFITAFFEMRNTKTGYRFNRRTIFFTAIIISFIFGISLTASNMGEKIHSEFSRKVPYYKDHLVSSKEDQWSRIEHGFLSGTIVSVEKNSFHLADWQDKSWLIVLNEDTIVRQAVQLNRGEKVKIIGEKKGDEIFAARDIRPWEGKGRRRSGHK